MTPAIHSQLAISPANLQAGFPPSPPSLSLPGLGNRLLETMAAAEARRIRYLFKLRRSAA